jgi:dephospho-CoA kinase
MHTATQKVPIIGLLGGIASGKSFYSNMFASAGCVVIDADRLVAELYRRPEVLGTFAQWWGADVRNADGTLNRAAVAKIIFSDPGARERLESYVHPLVRAQRDADTAAARAAVPAPRAILWDIPLLVEIGQEERCDLLVYVDTPAELREARAASRGWAAGELARREKLQAPLARKRELAGAVVSGRCGEAEARAAVEAVLASLGR